MWHKKFAELAVQYVNNKCVAVYQGVLYHRLGKLEISDEDFLLELTARMEESAKISTMRFWKAIHTGENKCVLIETTYYDMDYQTTVKTFVASGRHEAVDFVKKYWGWESVIRQS